MVIHYDISKRGKSHFAENKPCQDSNCVNVTSSGLTIAAVADGVGSAENSEFGSRIAADTAVGHLSSVLSGISPERVVIAELKRAFELAFAAVCKRADTDGKPLSSYDTTLSVAVYDGDTCVYGHSGDGAIVGLTDEGEYVEITTPQKGEDAVSVMPLRAGASYWAFGVYEKPLCSVILMTDGMRDLFCPSLLSKAENNVYIPAAAFFADPFRWSKSRNQKMLEAAVETFMEADGSNERDVFYDRLEDIYSHRIPEMNIGELQDFKANNIAPDLMDRIEDDKTVVGLINTKKEPAAKELSYYMEPDWMKYKKLRDDVLYGKTSPDKPPEKVVGPDPESPEVVEKEPPKDDEVITERANNTGRKNKFIIPLIAAGAAAAAVAIGVGIATSKPGPVDPAIASESADSSTESNNTAEGSKETGDVNGKNTDDTTNAGKITAENGKDRGNSDESAGSENSSKKTDNTTGEGQVADNPKTETTTSEAKITKDDITNPSSNEEGKENEFSDFLKDTAKSYPKDTISYVIHDFDGDGKYDLYLKNDNSFYKKYDDNTYKKFEPEKTIEETIIINFTIKHPWNIKTFTYSDDVIQNSSDVDS